MKFSVLMHNRFNETTDPDGQPRKAIRPSLDATHLEVEGSCRKCNATPLTIRGDIGSQVGRLNDGKGMFHALAYCTVCEQPIGTLKVECETLFGEEEDRSVLQGRPRVY